MNKKIIVASLLCATLLNANSHGAKLIEVTHLKHQTVKKVTTKHTSHWGYTGHEAPQNWAELNPKYKMCGMGVNQSPIDIKNSVSVQSSGLETIGFNYHADASAVINNGHTIQVNVDSHSSINIDGEHFSLKQFHFHTPSENEINGRSFPLEAHFVHSTAEGKLAVVGVLFELGEPNKALKTIWDAMPKEANKQKSISLSAKNIEALLPSKREYYYFNGSLTTPPCTEGVKWMVLKNYQTISKEQVTQFEKVLGHSNNRPTQPINARRVLK